MAFVKRSINIFRYLSSETINVNKLKGIRHDIYINIEFVINIQSRRRLN